MAGLAWVVIVAVAAKGSFTAYARRRRKGEYVEQYLFVWGAGTACLVVLVALVSGVVAAGFTKDDAYLSPGIMTLAALLALPPGTRWPGHPTLRETGIVDRHPAQPARSRP